jgi:hypothetical protein
MRCCSPTGRYLGAYLLVCSTLTQAGADEFDALLRRVPQDANAIVALNVEAIFDSPLAKSEGWKEQYADKYAAMPLILPPSAKRFVLASELDIATMTPEWEVASMELAEAHSAKDIQTFAGGILDTLSDTKVVWPKSGTCIAKFSDHEFGIFSPADRQEAARWIDRSNQREQHVLSPYLSQAIKYAEGAGPEIVMALDLKHVLRPAEIRAAIQRSEFLQDLDEDELTSLMSSLRGVMLGVRVGKSIEGKMVVDFGHDASLLQPVAKPLILTAMSNFGATLDEFEEWTPKVSGQRISIAGALTRDGMRRLFSLVDLDAAIVNRKKEKVRPDRTPEEQMAATGSASQRYFRTIRKYLTDVQRPSRRKDSLMGKALWVSNYARKINKISTHNVDPDLVGYADRVAGLMRDAVAEVHGVADRTSRRLAEVTPGDNALIVNIPSRPKVSPRRRAEYSPLAFTGVDMASALNQRTAIAEEELQAAMQAGQQIINQIKDETESIQREMSTRYGVEF